MPQGQKLLQYCRFGTRVVKRETMTWAVSSEYVHSETTYTLRGLREDELEAWADFCAQVFSYKPNPPPAGYFARHFRNDPDRHDTTWIRVAVCEEKIVASVRILDRRLRNGLRAAGIGEVCTAESHRRRGLSQALLQQALDLVREEFNCSFLHAAPVFFGFYQRMGYQTTQSKWLLVECERELGAPLLKPCIDVKKIQSLANYSQVQRSEQYWKEYLVHEVVDGWYASSSAYLAIKRDRVSDAGGDLTELASLIEQAAIKRIWIPACLWKGATEWKVVEEQVDEGWMYQTLKQATGIDDIIDKDSVVLPIDSF